MKVKAIAEGYYNDEIIKKGRVFNIKGDNIPSWCTLANGIETRNKNDDVSEPQTPAVPADTVINPETSQEETNELSGNSGELNEIEEAKEGVNEGEAAPEENAPEVADEASPEALSYLNRLIDEGIEKGVLIEDTDKKSIKQQIDELEKRLGRK